MLLVDLTVAEELSGFAGRTGEVPLSAGERASGVATKGAGEQARRRYRPPSSSAEPKPKRLPRQLGGRPFPVKLLLSEDEHRVLEMRAAAAGVSKQRYLVERALNDESRRALPERRATAGEFQRLRRELRGIARNINQLTMKANASGHVIAGTADALAAVTRLDDELTEAIRGLT